MESGSIIAPVFKYIESTIGCAVIVHFGTSILIDKRAVTKPALELRRFGLFALQRVFFVIFPVDNYVRMGYF